MAEAYTRNLDESEDGLPYIATSPFSSLVQAGLIDTTGLTPAELDTLSRQYAWVPNPTTGVQEPTFVGPSPSDVDNPANELDPFGIGGWVGGQLNDLIDSGSTWIPIATAAVALATPFIATPTLAAADAGAAGLTAGSGEFAAAEAAGTGAAGAAEAFPVASAADVAGFGLTGIPFEAAPALEAAGASLIPSVADSLAGTNLATGAAPLDLGSTLADAGYQATTGTGQFLEHPIDSLTNLLSGDIGSLGTGTLGAGLDNLISNPGGYIGDALQNGAGDIYDLVTGGDTPATPGGSPTPAGTTPGGVNPLWALIGGLLSASGGGDTVNNTASSVDRQSPLLTGQDPLSQQYRTTLGNQLNAANISQNPYFAPALQAAFQPVTQNLMENVLPGIRGAAIQSGGLGGSRQGIAEGKAVNDYTRNLANAGATAAYQFNQAGQQTQASALDQLLKAYGGTGQNRTAQQTYDLDPITQFLSGLTGSLGLIGQYNQAAGVH